MKSLILTFAMLATALQLPAQTSVRDLWLSMPDSVLPYLNHNLRLEHVDFIDMNVPSEVNNRFGGEGHMDTLTTCYASVWLNKQHLMQMRLLTRADSTQVLCVADTYYAPEPESTLRFFDTEWRQIDDSFGIPALTGNEQLVDIFLVPSDAVSATELADIKKMIDPVMVSISLPADEESLILKLSTPFLLKDEKERIDAVLVQTKLKWDGNLFK